MQTLTDKVKGWETDERKVETPVLQCNYSGLVRPITDMSKDEFLDNCLRVLADYEFYRC